MARADPALALPPFLGGLTAIFTALLPIIVASHHHLSKFYQASSAAHRAQGEGLEGGVFAAAGSRPGGYLINVQNSCENLEKRRASAQRRLPPALGFAFAFTLPLTRAHSLSKVVT